MHLGISIIRIKDMKYYQIYVILKSIFISDVITCAGHLRYKAIYIQGRVIINEGKTTSKTFL